MGVGAQVKARVAQRPPTVVEVHRLLARHQFGDDVDCVLQQLARLGHVEPDHCCIARQRTRTEAEHEPALRHVVELHGPLGDPERVVIAGTGDAGAEANVTCPLRSRGDEDLWRGDDLAAGGVVLSDPGLVVTEFVEMVDQFEIAVDQQRRAHPGRMEWCHEDAESHTRHA